MANANKFLRSELIDSPVEQSGPACCLLLSNRGLKDQAPPVSVGWAPIGRVLSVVLSEQQQSVPLHGHAFTSTAVQLLKA